MRVTIKKPEGRMMAAVVATARDAMSIQAQAVTGNGNQVML
jgi:hypothetical protein